MLIYECLMIMLMLCKSSYARLTPEVLQPSNTNKEKKHTEIITYIKTTACVEATSCCVRMSRLKHVGRTTIVTVRDREVRRDGGIFARRVGV